MRVEPELITHNKFKRLKKIIGDRAMEFIIALWGHCQSNQRGGFWAGADADYVEMLCDWDGESGVLFRALVECGKPKAGFIELCEGGLIVHDWNEMNSTFVANWKNGTKGGRPKTKGGNQSETEKGNGLALGLGDGSTGGSKPLNGHNPLETDREPTGNPIVTSREPSAPNRTEPNLTKLSSNGHNPLETDREPTGNPIVTQTPSAGTDDYTLARRLIAVLNEVTGAKFDPPLHELDGVVACLLDTNRDFAGIEKMVRRQAALWKGDVKARQWLKPGTLFGPKFHDYYGQRDLTVTALDKKTLQERIEKNPANRESAFHRPDASDDDKKRLREDKAALQMAA